MIPLGRMGEYTDHIERINIELSTRNKLKLLDALQVMLEGPLPIAKLDRATEVGVSIEEALNDKRRLAIEVVELTRVRWQWVLDNLDMPLAQALPELQASGLAALVPALTV